LQICYWIKQLKCGRKELNNIPSPGRTPDKGILLAVQRMLREDLFLSANAIARTIHFAAKTVRHCLHDDFGMKYRHLKWVPYMLTPKQKTKRAELAGSMLMILSHYQSSNFHFLSTKDESWIFYAYHHTHR
jgi:hypothetical protein